MELKETSKGIGLHGASQHLGGEASQPADTPERLQGPKKFSETTCQV